MSKRKAATAAAKRRAMVERIEAKLAKRPPGGGTRQERRRDRALGRRRDRALARLREFTKLGVERDGAVRLLLRGGIWSAKHAAFVLADLANAKSEEAA